MTESDEERKHYWTKDNFKHYLKDIEAKHSEETKNVVSFW